MDRTTRRKLNREIRELTDVMNEMDLTDIYTTFSPNTKDCIFFSATHGTCSKVDHILSSKVHLKATKNGVTMD